MEINKREVGIQIASTFKMIGKALSHSFQECNEDITIEQFFLLNILDAHENLTQQDLSVMLNKDKSGILRHIDGLEQKKMVVRIPDSDDRRKKILMLTKNGVETLKRLLEVEASSFEKFLKDVSDEQLGILSNILRKMQLNAQN